MERQNTDFFLKKLLFLKTPCCKTYHWNISAGGWAWRETPWAKQKHWQIFKGPVRPKAQCAKNFLSWSKIPQLKSCIYIQLIKLKVKCKCFSRFLKNSPFKNIPMNKHLFHSNYYSGREQQRKLSIERVQQKLRELKEDPSWYILMT